MQVASLSTPRDLIACCVFEDRLMAIGGYNSHAKPMDIVEYYDESENKWHFARAMNKPRGGSVAFVASSSFLHQNVKNECVDPVRIECATVDEVECANPIGIGPVKIECADPVEIECADPVEIGCIDPVKMECFDQS